MEVAGDTTEMSDAVKVALINQIPAIISALGVMVAVVLGFINRNRIGTVETKVDGRMSAMTDKVEDLQKLLLDLTGRSSYDKGQQDAQKGQSNP